MSPNPSNGKTGLSQTQKRNKRPKKASTVKRLKRQHEKNLMNRPLIMNTPIEHKFMIPAPNQFRPSNLETYQKICNSFPKIKLGIPAQTQPLSYGQMKYVRKIGMDNTNYKISELQKIKPPPFVPNLKSIDCNSIAMTKAKADRELYTRNTREMKKKYPDDPSRHPPKLPAPQKIKPHI